MCTLMILLLLHCLALPCTDDQLCCTLGKCCAKGLLNCAHLNIEHWVQVLCGTKVCKFYANKCSAKRFKLKCAHHSEIRWTLFDERPIPTDYAIRPHGTMYPIHRGRSSWCVPVLRCDLPTSHLACWPRNIHKLTSFQLSQSGSQLLLVMDGLMLILLTILNNSL